MTKYKQGKRKVVETVSIELKPLIGGYPITYITLTIADGTLTPVEFGGVKLQDDAIEIAKAALKAADDEMNRRNIQT